jgi:DNA-binding beta-propeller fold protein YncE
MLGAAGLALGSACYDGGNGTPPPGQKLNFPVGLAVSKGGGVLYVANSDFDLAYSNGTIQAYDLAAIRRDAVKQIAANPSCQEAIDNGDAGRRVPFGQECAPPVDTGIYFKHGVQIGAFATGLYLSPDGLRIFVPVRGNASLTWADVTPDDPSQPPNDSNFDVRCCNPTTSARCAKAPYCDAFHQAGNLPALEKDNTRQVSLPGEPFGLAFTPDGTAAVLTHQNDTKISLFATGVGDGPHGDVSLQFVLDGVPTGGIGVATVPHGTCASPDCPPDVRPSFLMTSRAVPQIPLLRYYPDEGTRGASSNHRPFLIEESIFGLSAAAGGSDSRGIAIDPTPRMKCVAEVPPKGGTRSQDDVDADIAACQRLPARVFIANRTPPSLVVGDIGGVAPDGSYDPDRLSLYANVPLVAGPSNVYLAPVVDQDGRYLLRVFVVCYDSQAVLVIDPDTRQLESVIRTGAGPFAMAFDPFDLEEVARRETVPPDPRNASIKKYRFAYIASFLHSYIQVLDLDGSGPDKTTFETIVFNLGTPTPPKGS